MAVSYTCPNPECGVTMKTPNRLQAGKSVKCPKCLKPFVPEPEEPAAETGAGTLKFADEPKSSKKAPVSKKTPDKPKPKEEPKKEAPAYKTSIDDDDEDQESIKKGYGVLKETEEEIERAEKNKPSFREVQDKFKKSARGPALALCVMPSQLLTAEGILTVVGGIVTFIWGIWPLVFNDAPPGDEETEEAFQTMALGVLAFVWGSLICYGASQMHELGSFTWAMVGSVLGILPILVGIFGIMILQNPKVKAGFEEGDAGPDEDDEEDQKKDEDDEDEDDEDEDDEEDEDEEDEDDKKRKKGKKSKRKDDEDD